MKAGTVTQNGLQPEKSTESAGDEKITMSIAQKKLAIEGALTPYLGEDHLLRALSIWEQKYAQQPTFALQRFINEFCDNATLMAQRSQILQSLIRALSGADGRPRDKPMATPEQATQPAAATAAKPDGSLECFTCLVEDVFSRTSGDMHIKIRIFLLENLPSMKLPATSQRALHAWLSQQYRIPADIHIEEKALRHLINLSYICLCEFMGPVKADKLLHDAITATEVRSPFPVRQLL